MRAATSLRQAIVDLERTAPNARDYDHNNFRDAVREHETRMMRLHAVRQDVEQLCLHIADSFESTQLIKDIWTI